MAKWYVLRTMSGGEAAVKKALEEQIASSGMSDYFSDMMIPAVQVLEVKRGKKVMKDKKLMPGYLLVKMKMSDESWHLVNGVQKVVGFLGEKMSPQPLSEAEVKAILDKIENESNAGLTRSLYSIGDKVIISDGPFDSFTGVVEEIDEGVRRLKVAVFIFGKSTQIELSFSQVKHNV